MKKIFYTLLVLLPLSLNAQWEIINDGSDLKGFLNTIDFVNENVGWIGGNSLTLLKTIDGGENWNSIEVADTISFKQIDFISESIGWAVCGNYWGDGGSVWKSSDGGLSWISQLSDFGFTSLYAIDENNIYAVGSDTIFKTTNGGTDWIDISPYLPNRNYNSVWFQDSQMGVVVGNYDDGVTEKGIILKTSNGGTNWNVTTVNVFNNIYDLQFLDSNNGYFRAHKDTANYICKTEDMCTSWNVIIQIISPYTYWVKPIKSYQFLDNNTAYAIMDDSLSSNNIMKSTNGGNNWDKITFVNKGLPLSKICFNKPNSGFVLSASSPGRGIGGNYSFPVFFSTADYGASWKIEKFNVPLTDLSFFIITRGFITGVIHPALHFSGIGVVFSTTDQGNNWEIKYYDRPIATFLMKNDSDGFLIENNGGGVTGKILKTINSWNNWLVVFENNNPESYEYYNDISFLNEQTGFIIGKYEDSTGVGAEILKTSDAGDNWNSGWKFPNTANTEYHLYSIYLNDNIGWSVGENGMILKYALQTGWEQQTSVTTLPLNKVFFTDDDHGWIAGGYQNENNFQKILLKTTNGGVNWIEVTNVPYLFRDIVFIDILLGWAIGYNQSGEGGLLRTTDGGNSWVLINGGLPAKLNALYIKDNYGWVVGDNGLILRNTDVSWVEYDQENVQPTEFILEQNYPNPFNPSTSIQYAIGSRQFVTLKVYDVLGREVATLVNEEQPAGYYEVEFSVDQVSRPELSSGVYFYRLTAGSYTVTKKMLLLK